MLQFYFLSILLNLLIGITLVYGDNEKISILDDKTFHLVVGILDFNKYFSVCKNYKEQGIPNEKIL